jgi:hypothetical protein
MACSHLKDTQYIQCMAHNPKNGEIPLTPKNDPYNLKNAPDAARKNEIHKKSIEEMNFVLKGILKNFTSRVLSEYFSQSSFLNSNSSLSTTLNNNKSNDGEMIELNPLNDPYLKNVIDFANKDEKCKKRMKELNLVPNSKNSVSWVLLKYFLKQFSQL